MTNKAFIAKMQYLISENKTDECFAELLVFLKIANEKLYDDLLVIKNRYSKLEKEHDLNIISYDQYSFQLNQITNSLVKHILRNVEKLPEIRISKKQTNLYPNGNKKVFISYSSSSLLDVKIANFLYQSLIKKGYKVFFARETITVGIEWVKRVEEGLKECNQFILLLSKKAMLSDMVIEEVRRAKKRRDKNQVPIIIPIRIKLPNDHEIPYDLSAYLNRIQHFQWNNDYDNETLLLFLDKIIEESTNYSFDVEGTEQIKIESKLPLTSAKLLLSNDFKNLDDQFYIERSEEVKCKDILLKPYSLLRIKAPRQYGKTSLLSRLMQFASAKGYAIIVIDFQHFSDEELKNLDNLLKLICADASKQLNLEEKVDKYWKVKHRPLLKKCYDYFDQYLLKEHLEPILFAVDKGDKLFKYPNITTEFFGMLRSWHELSKNPQRRNWNNFKIIITYSTDDIPIKDQERSPFNVGQVVLLAEFTIEQIFLLANKLGLKWTFEKAKELFELLGGHPYLVKKALYEISENNYTFENFTKGAFDDNGPFGEHLKRHFFKLYRNESRMNTLKEILLHKNSRNYTECKYLQAVGLVKQEKSEYMISSKLYEEYFKNKLLVKISLIEKIKHWLFRW